MTNIFLRGIIIRSAGKERPKGPQEIKKEQKGRKKGLTNHKVCDKIEYAPKKGGGMVFEN